MPLAGVTSLPVSVWPTPPAGEHVIRPGLALCWGGDVAPNVLGARPAVAAAAALFAFILAGGAEPGAGRMTLLRPRALSAGDRPGADGAFHVTIALDGAAWRDLVADDNTPGATQVREFSSAPAAPGITFPITPAARLAVESIRRCPFGGAFLGMALTARCHDLLIEFLTSLAARESPRAFARTQSRDEQIRAAAGLLAQQLEHPPTLAELARGVGLSETTLKRGFHQVFDTTVFGYLRARRMQRARAALQSGEATVLETVALVGYSNPSNFAAAFRRQFGVNPKTYQLAVRR